MRARWLAWVLAGVATSTGAAELPAYEALREAFCAPLVCPDADFGGCSSLRCSLLEEEMAASSEAEARERARLQYTAECIPEECPIADENAAVDTAVADWKRLKATPLACNQSTDASDLLLPGELRDTATDTLGVVSCAVRTSHGPVRARAADRNQWRCAALKRNPPSECGGRCGAPAVLLESMGVVKRRWCPSAAGGWGLCTTRTDAVAAQLKATGVDEFGVVCPPPEEVVANCATRLIPPLPSGPARKLLGEGDAHTFVVGVLPEAQSAESVAAPLRLVDKTAGVRVVTRALIEWSMADDTAPAAFAAVVGVSGPKGMTLVRELHPASGGDPVATVLDGWLAADLTQADGCSQQPEAIARGELVAWQQELVIADPTARPWQEMPEALRVGDYLRRCYERASGDVCVEVRVPAVVPPPPDPRFFAFAPAFLTSLDANASPAVGRRAVASYLATRSTSLRGQRVGVLIADARAERAILATSDGVVRTTWAGGRISAEPLGPTVEVTLAPLSDPARYAGRESDAAARVALQAALSLNEGVVLTAPGTGGACFLVGSQPRCRTGNVESSVPSAAPSAVNGLDVFSKAYSDRAARTATPAWTLAQRIVSRAQDAALSGYDLVGVLSDASGSFAIFAEAPSTGTCWGNLRLAPLHDLSSALGPVVRWGVASAAATCRQGTTTTLEGAFSEGAWLRALNDLRDARDSAHIVLPMAAKGEFLVARGFPAATARLTVAREEAASRPLVDVLVASRHAEPVSTEDQLHGFLRCLVTNGPGCTTQNKNLLTYFPRSRP